MPLSLEPGPYKQCACGVLGVRENTIVKVGDEIHRIAEPCYNMSSVELNMVFARYVGPERGRPWVKDQLAELRVVDMSVFDNANNCWYTYASLQDFFRSWIIVGRRGDIDG